MSVVSDIFAGGVSGVLEGVGSLALKIREAITGKTVLSSEDQVKLLEMVNEMDRLKLQGETAFAQAQLAIVQAESQSSDKWTSRGRPSFLYVMYVMLLAAIPMGIVYAVNPILADNVVKGYQAWLTAIPKELYGLFGVGYLGYGAFRSYDKKNGTA